MATDRGSTYSAPDPCSESLEKMTKRLTADLRARVRRLSHHVPLSLEWIELTDILQHLASVAMMEEKDSIKKDGSIWERDELCVRYIIEEGKINMLMRTMNEFKLFQYNAFKDGLADDDESKNRMKIFEHSLGSLLRCALGAVEALQTLDLTQLLEHIAVVLRHSLEYCEVNAIDHNSQELLAVSYLDLIFKQIENLNESSVMTQIEANGIVPLVLKHYEKFGVKAEKDLQERYFYFLSNLLETETYVTHRAKYIVNKEDKARLVLMEARVKELMASDPQTRKALRRLSDNIIRYK